jgi:hypothetical protein
MATRKKGKKSAKSKPARRTKATARRVAKKKTAKKLNVKKKGPVASKRTAPRTTARATQTGSRQAKPRFADASQPLRSGGQSGDLQGLSDAESVDSESVDELLEEGNSFEAGIVEGVEEASNNQTREVHTREVPEDDVPEEYLEKDE